MIKFIARVILFFHRKFNNMILACQVEVMKSRCTIGNKTVILEGANLVNLLKDKSKLCIGNESRIQGECIVHPHEGNITIGEYCYVGLLTRIWSAKGIIIGDRVLISHNVNIHDFNSHPSSASRRHLQEIGLFEHGHTGDLDDVPSASIVIEDDVWIGFGSTVLKGVKIGKGSIIGANTVITHDIPEYSIAVGNPAKIIKKAIS